MSIFDTLKRTKPRSSVFNLSEESKLSCNFGELVPILCKEVLPTDDFRINTELLIKFAPLKAPVMHRIKAKVDYFFVPTYQICSKFPDFINPKVNTEANPVQLPTIPANLLPDDIGSLSDFFGLPITQSTFMGSSTQVSALPFLAYQHIFNEYYRDQNLQVDYSTDGDALCDISKLKDLSGDLSLATVGDEEAAAALANLCNLRYSNWHRDYFTSALPSPQAGDEVKLPVGSQAPLKFPTTPYTNSYFIASNSFVEDSGDEFGKIRFSKPVAGEPASIQFVGKDSDGEDTMTSAYTFVNNNPLEEGYADLSEVQGISINNLRKLFSLQRFKELAERGGTRYPEIVQNFFGAHLPDIYFDRPVYLGGQVQPINIGEVVQTSQTTLEEGEVNSAQGTRAGIANSYGRTRTVRYKSKVHGFIIGLLRILPEATYNQGLERMWTRSSIYDFAFPQFANLGEQEILNKEIFATGVAANDNGIFGYTPRYAEYKTGHTHICGEFRTSLDYWHFGRSFANAPSLNSDFVKMNQMNYNPFNVTDSQTEHVYVNLFNHIIARRPLPYFGTPSYL